MNLAATVLKRYTGMPEFQADFNGGQLKFIEEKARETLTFIADASLRNAPYTACTLYADYARVKGWMTKDGSRLTSKGYEVAAAYLKR